MTGGGGFLSGPANGAEAQLDWEADCLGSPLFAFLDERVFLEAALLSLIESLMDFLEAIMVMKERESFRRCYRKKGGK